MGSDAVFVQGTFPSFKDVGSAASASRRAAPSPRRPRLEVLFSSLFIRNFLYGGRGINPCQVRACNPFASEMFSQNVFGVVVLHM